MALFSPIWVAHEPMKTSLSTLAIIAAFWMSVAVPAADAFASTGDTAVNVSNANEVVQKWRPEQHLFVKGDLGISADQLASLEQWLDSHASHWTVVLLQQAADEEYQAQDGRRYHGMDAVEHALGHGLTNRTEFGALTHPQTGETDGAVFVLFLAERKFSYFSSDLQDRRGLGESHWTGELDREAFRAMRNGGRILDAVKNTIALINGGIEKRLAAEVQAEKQQKMAAARAILERRQAFQSLISGLDEDRRETLNRIEESAREIRAAFPQAGESELANPPLTRWTQEIQLIREAAGKLELAEPTNDPSPGELPTLQQRRQKLQAELSRFLDLYAGHKSFHAMLSPIEQRLDLIADHPSGAAAETSDAAYQKLAEARRLHQSGDPTFIEPLQNATVLVEQGEAEIKLEKQRLQIEQERRSLIYRTLLYVASALAALLLAVLWFLNRRRRPALRRAHELFERKSRAVAAELANLARLEERMERVLGTTETFLARNFAGLTLTLGRQTFDHWKAIDTLAAQLNQLMASAELLLYPANPLAEAANLFSTSRYEHCLNLLNGESIHRLEPGLGDSNHSNQESLTADSWLTLEQAFQELRHRIQAAAAGLDSIDSSLQNVDTELEQFQTRIANAARTESNLTAAAQRDRFFRLPALFAKLLPAVNQDCQRAMSLKSEDPVMVSQQILPAGIQKVENALSLTQAIAAARETLLPTLQQHARNLKRMGYENGWIDDNLTQLSDQADQLVDRSLASSTSTEIEQFQSSLHDLGIRAKRCVEIAQEIQQQVLPLLAQREQEISEARSQLADKLKLDASKVLCETQYNPDSEMEQAHKQLQSADASLDYGGVESAVESLETIDIVTANARELVEKSLAAADEFFVIDRENEDLQQSVAGRLPELQQLIATAAAKWAASALEICEANDAALPESGDHAQSSSTTGTSPQQSHSIVSKHAQTSEYIKNIAEASSEARQLHCDGKVLEAANVQQLIRDDLHVVAEDLRSIRQHCCRLEKVAQENRRRIKHVEAETERLEALLVDARVQQSTLTQFAQWKSRFADLQTQWSAEPVGRDPFQDRQRLVQLAQESQSLSSQIHSDHQLFAEAQRSLDAAHKILKTAKNSVLRSLSDRIPDSKIIKQSQHQVSHLESELTEMTSKLDQPHGNWLLVLEHTNRVTSELGIIDATLHQQLQLAEDAVRELQTAAARLVEASSWRGDYGITIADNIGSRELESARHFLSEGEYTQSLNASLAAAYQAKQALDAARYAVDAKRQTIARKAEQRRRSRHLSSAVTGFSLGSSTHRRSSGISFGSRSRSSSFGSSSRSSNSGFKRSGW